MAIHSSTTQTKHTFFDKHTVLGTILLIIWGYVIVTFPAAIVMGIVCGIFRLGDINDYLFIGIVPMACITLLIHRIWFSPDFKGILFRGFFKSLRYSLVMLPFWAVLLLPDILNGYYPKTFTLKVISLAVTAGFSEETIFRGLPLSYLKRQLRSEKHVLLIVCVTAVIFGLSHVTNVLFGASLSASLVQGVSTICIGFYLGAVFMRGGNILVPMLIHALHDMLILSFQDADEVSAIVKRDAAWEDIIVVLLCFALAAFGYFLIRKSKRAEICAQWAETWSQTTESLPEAPAEPENITGGTI